MQKMKTALVLGGARSGKSSFAQGLAEGSGLARMLVATAVAGDEEMRHRIEQHRAGRGPSWQLVEEPLDLVAVVRKEATPEHIVLIDCLTLWLSNLMCAGLDAAHEGRRLADSVPLLKGPVIFVSNEVGFGIVPDNAMARGFRDLQGRLNQQLAQACDRVVLVVAGCPLQIKPAATLDYRF
ncbi:MAG: cobP [Hyphomicrobiales bacterium]|jgi:adenosylcobinamide kinase/adenosylcobinamide-phosphate guanylyltransferase|nr:cobP [Hyphomicrobiales bacterium]